MSINIDLDKQVIQLPIAAVSQFERKWKIRREKFYLIILSILLLLVSSLSAALFIVNSIVTVPEYDHVESTVKTFITEMQYQKDSYEFCIQKSIERCNDTLSMDYQREIDISLLKEDYNRGVIKNGSLILQDYQQTVETLKELVILYTTVNRSAPVFQPTCSSGEISELSTFYSIQSSENQILTIAENHANQTESLLNQIVYYYEQRLLYDLNYIQYKINMLNLTFLPTLDFVQFQSLNLTYYVNQLNLTAISACVTMDSSCTFTNSLFNQYQEIKEEYEVHKKDIQDQFDSFSKQVQSYYIAVQGLLVDIQELYGRIQQIEPYLEILGLSIGELPDLSLPPLKIPDLTILFELPSPEEIYQKLGPFFDSMQDNIAQAALLTKEKADQIVDKVVDYGNTISDFFSDYSPPLFNYTLLLAEFQDNKETFFGLTWEALIANALEDKKNNNNTENASTTFIPIIKDKVYSFFSTWTPMAFIGLDLDLSALVGDYAGIIRSALLLDSCYRIMKIISTIVKVCSKSSLSTITVNVREEKENDKSSSWFSKILPVILPYIMPLSITLFIIIVAIVMVVIIYIPLYQSYVNGCVNSASGTFLSKNLYSLAYNYVTMQGDTAAVMSEERYQQKKNDYCGNMEISSTQTFIQLSEEYSSLSQQIEFNKRMIEMSGKCLHPDVVVNQTLFTSHLQYPSLATLENSTFSCSSMFTCKVECTGPNYIMLQDQSYLTACTAEWFVHSNIVSYAVAFIVWILLNVSRYFIESAYEKLRLFSFSYQDVNIVLPATIRGEVLLNEMKNPKKIIDTSITRKRLWNQFVGYIHTFIAIVLQCVWIFMLIYVAPSISGIYEH